MPIPFFLTESEQKAILAASPKTTVTALLDKYVGKRRLQKKGLVSIDQLSPADVALIFRAAFVFKERYLKKSQTSKLALLGGKRIVNFFVEDSTRTRTSFELAARILGAEVVNVTGSTSSMAKKGETFEDTVRTIDHLLPDAIVIRDSRSGSLAFVASKTRSQIINAGDGLNEHPTQGLLDVYTIAEEFGSVRGRTVAIVGDILHSRVVGSQARLLHKLGAKIRFVGPATLMPVGAEKVFGAKVFTSLEKGIAGADVVSLLRIQLERAAAAFIPSVSDYAAQYCLTPARLKFAAPHAIVLHPGPINRDIDISHAVMESAQSRVEEQVTNGLAVRMGVLYLLLH